MYWPNCIVENKKLGNPGKDIGTAETVADYETCSTNCYNNTCCHFWNFDSSKYKCTLKKENGTGPGPDMIGSADELYVYYGGRECFGRGNTFFHSQTILSSANPINIESYFDNLIVD